MLSWRHITGVVCSRTSGRTLECWYVKQYISKSVCSVSLISDLIKQSVHLWKKCWLCELISDNHKQDKVEKLTCSINIARFYWQAQLTEKSIGDLKGLVLMELTGVETTPKCEGRLIGGVEGTVFSEGPLSAEKLLQDQRRPKREFLPDRGRESAQDKSPSPTLKLTSGQTSYWSKISGEICLAKTGVPPLDVGPKI